MATSSLPKISVIMPVLNRGKFIEKALRSVLDQGYDNLELIIMDGGSTDNTVEIIQRYASHITYWSSAPDASAAAAFNAGIQRATGDLIAHLMADDWFEPGILLKIGAAWMANPDADIISCSGQMVSVDAKTNTYKTLAVYDDPRDMHLTFYNIAYVASVICCRFIKKSLFDRIGLLLSHDQDGRQVIANDKEFLMRAVVQQARNIFIDDVGYTYLAHPESMSFGNNRAHSMRHCQEHMLFAEMYLRKQEVTFEQKVFLIYWFNDQSMRLMLYKLLAGELGAATSVAWNGMKRFAILWPLLGCCTFIRILLRTGLKKIFSQ